MTTFDREVFPGKTKTCSVLIPPAFNGTIETFEVCVGVVQPKNDKATKAATQIKDKSFISMTGFKNGVYRKD